MHRENRLSLALGLGLLALVLVMIGWVLLHPQVMVSHPERQDTATTRTVDGQDHVIYFVAAQTGKGEYLV